MIREKKIAIIVLLVYVLILPGFLYLAWCFLNNTQVKVQPAKGTLVYNGDAFLKKYFQYQLSTDPIYMLLTSQDESQSIIKDQKFEDFSYYLLKQMSDEHSPLFGIVIDVIGYFTIPAGSSIQSSFVGGEHNQSSMIIIHVLPSVSSSAIVPALSLIVDNWCIKYGATFSREFTRTDLIVGDAKNGLLGDLLRVDSIALPVALLVLAYCVGSPRLLLLPLCSLPLTFVIAFGILYPIFLYFPVSSVAPEITVAVVASLSIDYSLFILTRFCDQVKEQELLLSCNPQTEWLVVKNTALLSAKNIIVSGLTIAIAVGSLIFVPIHFFNTTGATMCVTILCAIFVSLTLQPALLLVFYNFFAHTPTWAEIWDKITRTFHGSFFCRKCYRPNFLKRFCCSCHSEHVSSFLPIADPDQERGLLREGVDGDDVSGKLAASEAHEYQKQSSSPWFKAGQFSYRHPFVTIFIVLAIATPFFILASQIQIDFDFFLQIPRGSPYVLVLKKIQSYFHAATVPYYVVVSSREAQNVTFWQTDDMVNMMRSIIETIAARTGQSYKFFASPNMLQLQHNVRWLTATESYLLYGADESYRYLFDRTVSKDNRRAACILITPPSSPFGGSAASYLHVIADVLKEKAAQSSLFDYGIAGSSSALWSLMKTSYEYFPLEVGFTFGGILLVMFVVFRSVILPVRMVLTVAYTIGFSYGVGVLVFQYTWLHSVWPALDQVNSYCFFIPIFSFLLLSALSLDYDVFLVSRIVEFKKKGYNDEASVTKAVWKTGPIISFAGIIMFVSIGSMAFSSVMMLSQFAVICAVAIILDTFVIRPFFVPAFMSITPKNILWWPRRFTELDRDVHDMRIDPHLTETDANHEEEGANEKE